MRILVVCGGLVVSAVAEGGTVGAMMLSSKVNVRRGGLLNAFKIAHVVPAC